MTPQPKGKIFGTTWGILIPLVLVAVGLISVILLLVQRHRWDMQYRDVIACLDYNATFQLSKVSGKSIDSVLTELRSLGYSSMAVSELTVLTATEKGYMFEVPDELLLEWSQENPALDEILTELLARRNFCIFGSEREAEASERFKLVYDDNFLSVPVSPARLPAEVNAHENTPAAVENTDVDSSDAGLTLEPTDSQTRDGWHLMSIPREAEVDFNKVNLGFDLDELRRIRGAGFDVVPRLVNNPKYDEEDLRAVFADLDRDVSVTVMPGAPPDVRIVLFEGDAVPGYPGNIGVTADEIAKRNLYWGWIEFEIQDGASALAGLLSPDIVITHSISAEEMIKQSVPVARARFVRALKERNVRLIYVRPFFTGLFESDETGTKSLGALEFNLRYFGELKNAIESNGFHIAREPSPPIFTEHHFLKILVVLGIIAFTALVIRLIFQPPIWIEPAFWIAAVLGSIGLFLLSSRVLYAGWALACAILAPLAAIAIAVALVARGKSAAPAQYARVLAAFLTAVLITLLGGIYIFALINSGEAFVKTYVFKGVMLSLAAPVLLIAIYFWNIRTFMMGAAKPVPGWIERLNALLDRKIEFVDMMVVFLGIAALALILLRSGNEAPIGVAQMELIFRARLEDLLSVRPRTKEIFGLPALFFFLAYFFRRKPPSIVLLLLGAVALTSVVNTFCHLHTPIAISLVRTLIGAILGMINGSILYLVWWIYLWVLKLLGKKA